MLEPIAYLSETAQYSPRVDWLYLGLAIAIALVSHQRQRKSFYYAGLVNTGVALVLHRRPPSVVRQAGVGGRVGDRRARRPRRRIPARRRQRRQRMKIVIAGGSGFLGRALDGAARRRRSRRRRADADGRRVERPCSDASSGSLTARRRLPDAGQPTGWAREVEGTDAVVNLAGEGIADRRWTAARKRALARKPHAQHAQSRRRDSRGLARGRAPSFRRRASGTTAWPATT